MDRSSAARPDERQLPGARLATPASAMGRELPHRFPPRATAMRQTAVVAPCPGYPIGSRWHRRTLTTQWHSEMLRVLVAADWALRKAIAVLRKAPLAIPDLRGCLHRCECTAIRWLRIGSTRPRPCENVSFDADRAVLRLISDRISSHSGPMSMSGVFGRPAAAQRCHFDDKKGPTPSSN